ncbi:CPXCG motif-containing cysteine-rich protein [Hahella ganghwensis]
MVTLDCSSEVQDYYEDCRVCCRPISVHVICNYEGEVESLVVKTENEV